MPNWCSTTYYFYGNKKDITEFKNKVNEWIKPGSKYYNKKYYDLANIYNNALKNCMASDNERCRGDLVYISEAVEEYDVDINSKHYTHRIHLETETAWGAMPLMWEKIFGFKHWDIVFTFCESEPGMGVRNIYDPYGIGDFEEDEVYIDSSDENEDDIALLEEIGFNDSFLSFKEYEDKLRKFFNDYEASLENLTYVLGNMLSTSIVQVSSRTTLSDYD